MQYLKKSTHTPVSGETQTTEITQNILHDIASGGEVKAIEYARKLDQWEGEIVIGAEEIEKTKTAIPIWLKDDIRFSYDRVRTFAEKQLASMTEFEAEISPGMFAGQKLIPVQTAGCYVPGGRYAHFASAIMSIATAKVAGVKHIVACSPAKAGEGIHPAILYTMNLCGADSILALGGVQAIASMADGLFTGHKADILVGPGNRFVAEAKRILYGKVGIDLFAGPTEIAIIADDSADFEIIACDLVGQAEHGVDSPAWLFTDSESLGQKVLKLIPQYIEKLPDSHRKAAEASWRDYGEIIIAETREELVEISDRYAAEHLEVQTRQNDWFLQELSNYGSLFVGEETTVAFGDKCSGTNHILPTKGAARYTGGLSVGKFIKTLTYQRMTAEANRQVAATAARISRIEGMEAHARTGDIRLEKYFPNERFLTQVSLSE